MRIQDDSITLEMDDTVIDELVIRLVGKKGDEGELALENGRIVVKPKT